MRCLGLALVLVACTTSSTVDGVDEGASESAELGAGGLVVAASGEVQAELEPCG